MRVLTVTDYLNLINETLKALSEYEEFGVEGEVSGYRLSQGQWVSFDLKDDESLVNVFMPIWKLKVPIVDGMRVRVLGMARVYQKYGKFSLSAESVEPVGEGALRKALAALRARLEAEGLFDPSRKRHIDRFPGRIALIASRESAAYGDFVRIVRERWPLLEIDVFHVLVQGEKAPRDIIAALDSVEREHKERSYSAIVLTRGGGSLEELMAFNDELLVRALFATTIPTIVAIGHERDLTLSEEVADVRGSTPTDAARRLVPDQRDIAYELMAMTNRIVNCVEGGIRAKRAVMDRVLTSNERWLRGYLTTLQRIQSSIHTAIDGMRKRYDDRLLGLERLFRSLDPKGVLARGFSLVRDTSGQIITGVKTLSRGQAIGIQFQDGHIGASVQVVQQTERD